MFKNVAGQKVRLFAFDATTNLPKTGDQANITASVSKDGGAVTDLADTSATQEDATKAPGYYQFDLSQAESNADILAFSGRSSTANVVVIATPVVVFTRPKLVLRDGTAQSGGNTNIQLDAGASAIDDYYSGGTIILTGGAGAGQARALYGYIGANKTATIHANYPWAVNPDATTTFVIIAGIFQVKGGYIDQALQVSGLSQNGIADAILARSVQGGSSGARTVGQALAALRNKVAFDVPGAGQFTVFDTDDTTPLWTGTYTATPGASPITVLDPTG